MAERKNISGEFLLKTSNNEYTIKVTYGAIERLEQGILGRSIMELLTESLNGRAKLSDITTVFYTCMCPEDQKQISKEDFGQEVIETGLKVFARSYTKILTYAMTGEEDPDTQKSSDKKK